MRLTMLGCGTSSGVPRIGNDWGACDPDEPRNCRTRVSILVQSATTTILVDTGPDMRAQLLAAGVGAIDAVIWTHEHADHTHGIDDLRQLFHVRGAPIPGFAREATRAVMRERFTYVFAGRSGYPPSATLDRLADETVIGDIVVRAVDQPHGDIASAGLRFEHGGYAIGYATDFNTMTDDMLRLYGKLDLLVIDALRRPPHPTHPHLDQALGWIARLAPKQALLTHMDQTMDYVALAAELPPRVAPGHDGLEVRLA